MIRYLSMSLLGVTAAALSGWAGDTKEPPRSIDQELLQRSRALMKHLQDKGYRNVGVLKFRLQVGAEKPRFDAGRLPGLLATRLENALIYANSVKEPVGVTRNAGAAAARHDPGATWATAEGRK